MRDELYNMLSRPSWLRMGRYERGGSTHCCFVRRTRYPTQSSYMDSSEYYLAQRNANSGQWARREAVFRPPKTWRRRMEHTETKRKGYQGKKTNSRLRVSALL